MPELMRRKVCIVTGTRAEYGLLRGLLSMLRDEPNVELQLVVTGMHLSAEFGHTYKEIQADGFVADAKVEMLLSSDTGVGIAKSIGLGVIGFADAFHRLCPDIVVLPGDRFEILAAAQAALVTRIPMAHLFGGDTTEGAFDEAIRHSITKMSHLHFVTNETSARRVCQLGEDPAYVFNVGTPAIDQIKSIKLLDREALERELSFEFRPRNLLITFHPATLGTQSALSQFDELLVALDKLGEEVGLIFTRPNADPEGRALIARLNAFVAKKSNAQAYDSLGQMRYLSALAQVDAMVGNSSSGLYEAPSFAIPTVNIGDRQKGRLQPGSVLNCPAEADAILRTLEAAFAADCSDTINPYGDGSAARQILDQLIGVEDPRRLLQKRFFTTDPGGLQP
jgi:UDP-N-acetylglucosamine 2-epimerase (non-hydrolysing)/GDP/UDP-N,N'-diacetylbacillosamine 2-epimerase (hydrolysing)